MKRFIEGKQAALEYDLELYDRYGRTLANAYVDDIFLQDVLLSAGIARTLVKENRNMQGALLRRGSLLKCAGNGPVQLSVFARAISMRISATFSMSSATASSFGPCALKLPVQMLGQGRPR